MNVRSFTRYSCLYFEKDTNFSKAGQSTYVILPQRPSSCHAGAIMLFNVFIWRAENPVRADKSAPTVGQMMLLKVKIAPLHICIVFYPEKYRAKRLTCIRSIMSTSW